MLCGWQLLGSRCRALKIFEILCIYSVVTPIFLCYDPAHLFSASADHAYQQNALNSDSLSCLKYKIMLLYLSA